MTVLAAARRSAVASVSGATRTAVRRSLAPAVQSRNITFSSPVGGYESEKVRPKLFIPGPIEFSPEVLRANGSGARAHTDSTLIEDFGKCIELTRKAFVSTTAQPFLVSGSGAMGWDVVATNLISEGGKILVTNTGFFCTRFENCLKQFGLDLTSIHAPTPGSRVLLADVEKALKDAKANGKPFEAITVTHVDTSTAVLADLKAMCDVVKAVSPDTLVIVDAVCSAAGEELRMDEWGVDFVLTGSQKAFGVPPGLSIMCASQKAMSRLLPKDKIKNYFCNMQLWLPIMEAYEARKPSYFATPACNLIGALRVGLEQMQDHPNGMDDYFRLHRENKTKLHKIIQGEMGLELLTESSEISSNLLTCMKYPAGKGPEILPIMKKKGWILAAGLHPEVGGTYFRMGHMGYSVTTKPEYCTDLLKDLKDTLEGK